MILKLKNKDTLIFNEFLIKCCIGSAGLKKNKIEGDNATPIGTFTFGNIYFRKDRVKKPDTILKCIPIKKNFGWCNDINSKFYNKIIYINKHVKHEKMFRRDYKYNYLIVINYNTKKIIKNKGSAIFLHLTKKYKSTSGCIAVKTNDFLTISKLITKNSKIEIF